MVIAPSDGARGLFDGGHAGEGRATVYCCNGAVAVGCDGGEGPMMYPYMTLEDGTEVVHSDLKEAPDGPHVLVHFERPSADGFGSVRFELPTYELTLWEGAFSEEELAELRGFLQANAQSHLPVRRPGRASDCLAFSLIRRTLRSSAKASRLRPRTLPRLPRGQEGSCLLEIARPTMPAQPEGDPNPGKYLQTKPQRRSPAYSRGFLRRGIGVAGIMPFGFPTLSACASLQAHAASI